jgi:hypothetical protein
LNCCNEATVGESNSLWDIVLHPQPEKCPKILISRVPKTAHNILTGKLCGRTAILQGCEKAKINKTWGHENG